MRLISVENYELKVADEALLVKPIRRLFNMDRTLKKEKFYQQMSVLFFCYDPRSNYSYIVDENDRLKEVLAQEGIRDFRMTAEFKAAVAAYRKLCVTSSSVLLESTKVAIDKVSRFLREVDLNALDDRGKPIYTINNITAAIKQIPELSQKLADAEKALAKEMEEGGKARGSQELTIFDNNMD